MGRGKKRLQNIYNSLNHLKTQLLDYVPLHHSQFIFVKEKTKFSMYSHHQYEVIGDIVGVGHNSVSYIGEDSYLSLYDENGFFYKKRYSESRYLMSIINGSTIGVRKEKIIRIDNHFKSFFCNTEDFLCYLPLDKVVEFYCYLQNEYSDSVARVLASVVGHGDDDINNFKSLGIK